MNRLQYLLTKLAEEASEISQIALKAQQFGLDSVSPKTGESNRGAIKKEVNDLLGVLWPLHSEFELNTLADRGLIMDKVTKLNKYFEICKDLGLAHEG